MRAVTQEPERRAHDEPPGVDHHRRLRAVGDLVVERLDGAPQVHHAEHFAHDEIPAHHVGRGSAGLFLHAVHEGAADAIDHAVRHMRGDDLAA